MRMFGNGFLEFDRTWNEAENDGADFFKFWTIFRDQSSI